MVTVYTKENCVQCKFVKKWLVQHRIKFIEKPVAERLSEFKAHGLLQAPIVYRDDTLITTGFVPNKLTELL